MILGSSEVMPIIKGGLERGQSVSLTVSGSSMIPFILNGDVVEIEPVKNLQLGDLVLAEPSDGRYVIHRIVKTGDNGFWLRGDAQRTIEGPLPPEEVLGKVILVSRGARTHNMDRKVWRFSSMVWLYVHPFGLSLIWFFSCFRKLAGKIARTLQRISFYRTLLRYIHQAYEIREISQAEYSIFYNGLIMEADQVIPDSKKDSNYYPITYAACRGEKALGVVNLFRHENNDSPHNGFWLYNLVVKTPYRGMGIGSSLTKKVIEESIIKGAEELFLLVFENNLPAIKMYKKFGFEQVTLSEIDEYLIDDVEKYGRQRLIMRKKL